MTAATAQYPIKLSLIGDHGIGKSSLLCKISSIDDINDGDYNIAAITLTVGDVRYKVDIIEQHEVHDNLNFSRMHLHILGWIVAFDLTQITSADKLEQYFKTYEEKILWRTDGEAPDNLFLLGTKSDLATDKRLPKSTIEEFAKTKSVRYFETSSQTRQGVQEAVSAIIEIVSKSNAYTSIGKPKFYGQQTRKKKTRCVVM
jgi:GTPase SAR1 family protein